MPKLYFDITEPYRILNTHGPFWHAMSAADPGDWGDLLYLFIDGDSAYFNTADPLEIFIYGTRDITSPASLINDNGYLEKYWNVTFNGWDRAAGGAPWALVGSYVLFPLFATVSRFCGDDTIGNLGYNTTELLCCYFKSDAALLFALEFNARGCTFETPVLGVGYAEEHDEQHNFVGCIFKCDSFQSAWGQLWQSGGISFRDCLFVGRSQTEIETDLSNIANLEFVNCVFIDTMAFQLPPADGVSETSLLYGNSGLPRVALESFQSDDYEFGFADDFRDGYGAWYFSPFVIQYQHRHYRSHRKLAIF